MAYTALADVVDADAKVVAETCLSNRETTFTKVPTDGRGVRTGLW
jgi:hypothetical protein